MGVVVVSAIIAVAILIVTAFRGLGRGKAISEILKNMAEITAFLVAAWWAYDKFLKTEVPLLKERFIMSSSVKWSPAVSQNHCWADFLVNLKNIGRSDVQIGPAVVRV